MGSAVIASTEDKRAALQAVLESDTFARSDQLRNFLRYVTEMSLEGRAREVTEYLIAVEALGRPRDFSPADDSSVRSRAHELRRKLQRYYESESPGAPLRIDLPKGCYTPKFVLPSMEPADAPDLVEPRGSRLSKPAIALALVAVLSLAGAAALGWMLRQEISKHKVNPLIAEAWGPLALADSNTLVCVATPLHLLIRPYMSIVAEGFPKYPAPPELYSMYRQHRPLSSDTHLDMHPVDNSIQMGHLGAMLTLAGVFQSHGISFQALPERSAPVSAIRGRNAIVIGDPQDSNVAAELLEKTPLTIDFDPAVQDLVIRDRRPGHTPSSYVPKRGRDKRYSDAYGLITVLPSPGARQNQRVVVLSGITSVGSQGVAEFFSSPRELEALSKQFAAQGVNRFPQAYQVVVHCKSNDTLLVSEDYAAHVIIQN